MTPTVTLVDTGTSGLSSTNIARVVAAGIAGADVVFATVCCFSGAATFTCNDITDTVGNDWTVRQSFRHPSDSGKYIAMAYCLNPIDLPAGGTITAVNNTNPSASKRLVIGRIDGLSNPAIDKFPGPNSSSGGTNPWPWTTNASGVLTEIEEVLIAFGCIHRTFGSPANTPTAGWIELGQWDTPREQVVQYKITASNASVNEGGSWDGGAVSSSGQWMGALMTFMSVPAGGNNKIKIGGAFSEKPVKIKAAGAFTTKSLKTKIGGVFV